MASGNKIRSSDEIEHESLLSVRFFVLPKSKSPNVCRFLAKNVCNGRYTRAIILL
jgi:hypothetical protein